MSYLRLLSRVATASAVAAALTATAFSQPGSPEPLGGPLTREPVLGAPFSADVTTTVRAILGDGTRLDQTTTDRYYRDSTGRVRVERLTGLPAPSTVSERWARTIVAPSPGHAMVYTIDADTRSYVLSPRSILASTAGGHHVYIGGGRFVGFRRAGDLSSADPAPFAFVDAREESLGRRRIAGIETTGRRITMVVPRGSRGNDRAIEIMDERWESPELRLLIESRHSDSRSTIEYRLSNIVRDEQAAHLFEIPPDYTRGYPMTSDDRGMSFVLAESFRANQDRRTRVLNGDDARDVAD
jgi:hypothetical protein